MIKMLTKAKKAVVLGVLLLLVANILPFNYIIANATEGVERKNIVQDQIDNDGLYQEEVGQTDEGDKVEPEDSQLNENTEVDKDQVEEDNIIEDDKKEVEEDKVIDENKEEVKEPIEEKVIKDSQSEEVKPTQQEKAMPQFKSGENVIYQTHVQYDGWQDWKSNSQMSGTEGRSLRLEGIRINISGLPEGASIAYRTHVQYDGWQEWKRNGEMSGTEGRSLRLEGIQIKLEGVSSDYHVEYRTHVQYDGWQEWKRDGEVAGTTGRSLRLEAIEIRIVKNSGEPKVSYNSYIQGSGWQGEKVNGALSGTSGQSKRIESLMLRADNLPAGNDIQFRTHIQNEGWSNWLTSHQSSGKPGSGRRIEAIQVKLKKPLKGYKLIYRVHVQNIGWQDWKSDGEIAGTTGQALRIEAIEIKIVKDDGTIAPPKKMIVIDPGHGGNDSGASATHGGKRYIEKDLNMEISLKLKSELEARGFNVMLTRGPSDWETLPSRESLERRVNMANNLGADFFISVHQNSATASARGVEVYYSSATPLSGGRLLENGVELNEVETAKKKTRTVQTDKVNVSSKVAREMVDGIAGGMGMTNRGAKDKDFYVVKNTHMPAVLLECGFITNPTEAKNLASQQKQQQMAQIVADKIAQNF